MTDTILALIPTYGLWVTSLVVILACLAVPLPASMLAMATGSFAAAGDLVLWQAISTAYGAYILGDQIAFRIARSGGGAIIDRLRRRKRAAGLIERAEAMLQRHGVVAVFLSRTIFSPLGPYMSYLCGAANLRWISFTLASFLGAACWASAYVLLGYYFANRLVEIADLITNGLGIIVALAVAFGSAIWLRRSWKRYKEQEKQQ